MRIHMNTIAVSIMDNIERIVRESPDSEVTLPRGMMLAILDYAKEARLDASALRRHHLVRDAEDAIHAKRFHDAEQIIDKLAAECDDVIVASVRALLEKTIADNLDP